METPEYEDLSNKVYKTLKIMILKGELVCGQKIVQESLAERLGVSRTPLLAAFSKLEKDMLVDIVPRRGAFVKRYSPTELLDIYDLRLRLEPLGAREAAERATEDEIVELRGTVHEFRNGVVDRDEGRIKESDYAIHMRLMKMSGNRLLFSIISNFIIMVISNIKGLPKDPSLSAAEHDELLAAVAAHDGESAERIMYRHIEGSRETLRRSIREGNARIEN